MQYTHALKTWHFLVQKDIIIGSLHIKGMVDYVDITFLIFLSRYFTPLIYFIYLLPAQYRGL